MLAATTPCLVAACAAGTDAATGGGSGASAATGGASQAGAGGSGANGDGNGGPGGLGVGGAPDDFEACATEVAAAELAPVSMFLSVDRSQSMSTNDKWDDTEAAFFSFFEDPQASKVSVALRFWPEGTCNDDICNAWACSLPNVELGSLGDPAHVTELKDEWEKKWPSGNTPTSVAIRGAKMWAEDHIAATGEDTVIVFVTDGEPTGCDTDIDNIAEYAEEAYDELGVRTFAVGLAGSQESTLNTIAQAGQTGQGIFIGNGNAQADLLEALKQIQLTAVACSYLLPTESAEGEAIDPDLVNVAYSTGGASETIGQVANEAACASAVNAWYYDDPNDPSTIEFCPQTCELIQGEAAAEVEIVFGCATEPAE